MTERTVAYRLREHLVEEALCLLLLLLNAGRQHMFLWSGPQYGTLSSTKAKRVQHMLTLRLYFSLPKEETRLMIHPEATKKVNMVSVS